MGWAWVEGGEREVEGFTAGHGLGRGRVVGEVEVGYGGVVVLGCKWYAGIVDGMRGKSPDGTNHLLYM